MIERGGVHWADFGDPVGSRPAKRRPVVVVQADSFNRSRLATVLVVAVTSKLALAVHPGNVLLPAAASGLPRDSVINVTTLTTFNRDELGERVGIVPSAEMRQLDEGLRMVLAL